MTVIYKIKTTYKNPADANRAAWVAQMMAGSESSAAKIGVSPEAIVAQAALESGWGKAGIGNNVFGIRADPSWRGPTQSVHTREVVDGQDQFVVGAFRDYASVQESIEDHLRFLEQNSRYRANGVFDKKGDLAYFEALQRAGYATDPNYASVLKSILDLVRRYTANMERVELDPGYKVDAGGNVMSVPAKESSTVKNANGGMTVVGATTILGAVTPIVAASNSIDWKLAAVFGTIVLLGGAMTIFYFTKIRRTRIEMDEQGVL